MGKKRTFNDFSVRLRPKPSDFLVGFDRPEVGGEKIPTYTFKKLHGINLM